jgi:hypothetical protein
MHRWMKHACCWLLVVSVLILAGCRKKASTPSTSAPPTSSGPAPITPSGGGGGGVGAMLPSVGRQAGLVDLQQLGQYYLTYATVGQSPKRLEDLSDLRRDLPKVYQAIQEGQYVVFWNANLNAPAGASNTILAYGKDVPTKGGVTLFLDGSVRNITAQEFQTAAKAGTP